ncbi:hypothetical protein SAMN05421872_116118 [Nocardioides lianchengensis]|uniref:Uncharacterized protein n=1 Tax=Nocardioides lianchengensis TaxID=1045774 RepID=A0A1G7AY95_9ACTN|nr:hypothetical protein SAMN05421872_116118 [Nocardioides lianchengensis]
MGDDEDPIVSTRPHLRTNEEHAAIHCVRVSPIGNSEQPDPVYKNMSESLIAYHIAAVINDNDTICRHIIRDEALNGPSKRFQTFMVNYNDRGGRTLRVGRH